MDIEIRGQAWGFTGFATALRNIATGLDSLKANVKIVSRIQLRGLFLLA